MNDLQKIDDQALRALAYVVTTVRPDWDRPGVLAKLTQATRNGHTYGHLAVAAVRAALDESNRTPAVIPLDGAHWREPVARPEPVATPTPPPFERGQRDTADYEMHAAAARALLRASLAGVKGSPGDEHGVSGLPASGDQFNLPEARTGGRA